MSTRAHFDAETGERKDAAPEPETKADSQPAPAAPEPETNQGQKAKDSKPGKGK